VAVDHGASEGEAQQQQSYIVSFIVGHNLVLKWMLFKHKQVNRVKVKQVK